MNTFIDVKHLDISHSLILHINQCLASVWPQFHLKQHNTHLEFISIYCKVIFDLKRMASYITSALKLNTTVVYIYSACCITCNRSIIIGIINMGSIDLLKQDQTDLLQISEEIKKLFQNGYGPIYIMRIYIQEKYICI